MINMLNFAKRLWSDDEGATAIEYGLLAALIAVVLIISITALGGELSETFAGVETDLNAANAGGAPAAD